MKAILLILAAISLTGCGSTRTENKQTVERYSETTTAPDGQVSTKAGLRTVEENSTAKSQIDLTPPVQVTSLLGILSGLFSGPVLPAILASVAAACAAHARATGIQSDERKGDLEETWRLYQQELAKGKA